MKFIFRLYIYSNVPFDLGEIQSTLKEHEFCETLDIELNEGFSSFDASSQFHIDFGEIGKYQNQDLTIEITSLSDSNLKTMLVINPLKREVINQRISEDMINEMGLQLSPVEKVN